MAIVTKLRDCFVIVTKVMGLFMEIFTKLWDNFPIATKVMGLFCNCGLWNCIMTIIYWLDNG